MPMPNSHQPTTTLSAATTTLSAATTTAKFDSKQIIDILPSYISLYQTPNPNPNPNPNPTQDRTAILKWFSSLTPSQRVANLTIVDPTFTQLLLKMHRHVTTTTFFLLPDIPTASRDPLPLPTLLTRRSRGLLDRVASKRTRALSENLLMFSSESVLLDTVSFREGFLGDVEGFVGVMDEVSGFGFLNGCGEDWGELGLEFGEMRWLKSRGYYSMEEFVANRVEVALRVAWLNGGGGGRKRGVKLKEKSRNLLGFGVNLYYRMKGCVDWWERLDYRVKIMVWRTVFRNSAKSLV